MAINKTKGSKARLRDLGFRVNTEKCGCWDWSLYRGDEERSVESGTLCLTKAEAERDALEAALRILGAECGA